MHFAISKGAYMKKMVINGDSIFIQSALDGVRELGGKAYIPCGEYTVDKTVIVDTPSSCLEGECWAYSSDPNGVFEAQCGTKLRLCGNGHSAISVGVNALAAGVCITSLGVQGDIKGMDTRPLINTENISAASGLHFGAARIDQGEFSKLSFCGLGTGICAEGTAELDACTFSRINTDGCGIGIYFAPRSSYYTQFKDSIVADTPSYGFYANGSAARMFNIVLSNMTFVRNCGSNPTGLGVDAAVYLKDVASFILRDNLFDSPGTFWYYSASATKNEERKPTTVAAAGLMLEGNKCRILQNIFTHSSCESIRVTGHQNILMCNISDGDVIIEGRDNTVVDHVFTSADARLILKGDAAQSTVVVGVPESRIVRE